MKRLTLLAAAMLCMILGFAAMASASDPPAIGDEMKVLVKNHDFTSPAATAQCDCTRPDTDMTSAGPPNMAPTNEIINSYINQPAIGAKDVAAQAMGYIGKSAPFMAASANCATCHGMKLAASDKPCQPGILTMKTDNLSSGSGNKIALASLNNFNAINQPGFDMRV